MIFETENYRQFIRGYIKMNGLTHEQFIKAHPNILSKPGFSVFLSRGRNLSIKTFFALTKAMKLKSEEAFYLFILSMENDLDPLSKENLSIISLLKSMRQKIMPLLQGGEKPSTLPDSPELQLFADAFNLLDKKSINKLLDSLANEVRVNIARQKHKNLSRLLLARIAKTKG